MFLSPLFKLSFYQRNINFDTFHLYSIYLNIHGQKPNIAKITLLASPLLQYESALLYLHCTLNCFGVLELNDAQMFCQH